MTPPVRGRGREVRRSQESEAAKPLGGVVELLWGRLAALEGRIREGDETAWSVYLVTLQVLVALLGHVEPPGRTRDLLTTKEMAERLGIAPKTLLAHRRRGSVRPAIKKGKLIRWKGSERLE
jgi:hypothetical protein